MAIQLSRGVLNGGDDAKYHSDGDDVDNSDVDKTALGSSGRGRSIGLFAARGSKIWDRQRRSKKPSTRFPTEARFPSVSAPALGVGDAF